MNNILSAAFSKCFSLGLIAATVFVSSVHAQFDSKKMNELLASQSYYSLYCELEPLLYTKRDALATNWVMTSALEGLHVPYMYEYAARLFVKRCEVAAPTIQEFVSALVTMVASVIVAKCDVDVCCVLSEETSETAHNTFNNLICNYRHRLDSLIQGSDKDLLKEDGALSFKAILKGACDLIQTKVRPMIEAGILPNAAWAGYTSKARFGGMMSTWIWFNDVEKKLKNICADTLTQGERVKRIRQNSLAITISILNGYTDWADFFELKHDNFSELQQSMIMPTMASQCVVQQLVPQAPVVGQNIFEIDRVDNSMQNLSLQESQSLGTQTEVAFDLQGVQNLQEVDEQTQEAIEQEMVGSVQATMIQTDEIVQHIEQ